MHVDEVKNGIVIDHIAKGNALKIYNLLKLDDLNCTAAILKNVPSKKMGSKDIIKIEGCTEVDFDVLGFLSPSITVNVITNGVVTAKHQMQLPEKITDIITCQNPRCITTTEQGIHQIFRLTDKEKGVYRCIYCEAENK